MINIITFSACSRGWIIELHTKNANPIDAKDRHLADSILAQLAGYTLSMAQ